MVYTLMLCYLYKLWAYVMSDMFAHTVQITFIFIDFRVCDFVFAFKTPNAPCVSRFKQISICVLNAAF